LWNDPALGIEWPVEGEPRLAAKDAEGKAFGEIEVFE
jgi:dTDP-4-dehydrorhamnose 3,5-epimerase